jgi:hypothetical protein
MPITQNSVRAYYGLQANAEPDSVGVSGTNIIGVLPTSTPLPGVNIAYAVKFEIAEGVTVTFNPSLASITGTTSGTSQVETATVVAAAGATSSGNLAVTVTAAGVTGSPLAFSVALVSGVDTTASLIAAKIRTALVASSALTALYTVGGAGANVVLTRTVPAANDTTLNIAIAAGLGVSAVTTSTSTTAGVQPTKAYRIPGQAWGSDDYQGVTIPTVADISGVLIQHSEGTTSWEINANNMGNFDSVEAWMRLNSGSISGLFIEDWELTAVAASVLTVFIFGT